ncbi:pleckstrin homology domain-containing family G member 7 isoform X1 [Pogona vitticeps]
MDCECSFQEHEVTHMEEQCHIPKGTELLGNNLDLIEKDDTEDTVFFSNETITPTITKIKLLPSISTRKQGFREDTHLLKVPSENSDDGDVTPYQFDRHAPERISTSPTLRRLRKSMPLSPQVLPLQNDTENARAGNKAPQGSSSIPVCQSSSSIQCHSSSTYTRLHTDSLLPREQPKSADPTSVKPYCQENFSDYQTSKNSKGNNPSFLSEREQNSQEQFKESDLHNAIGQYRSTERRHSSVVVSLPGFEMFPGDLLIPDSAAKFLYHSASLQSSESKKPWWPFAKKGMGKDKQKQISDLENYLSTVTVKMSKCSDYEFYNVKDKTWLEIMEMHQLQPKGSDLSDIKKNEAVWELFTTECTYFLDHLLVLKMIFMDTLQNLQSKALLQDVDSGLLFANLEELNQISLNFVTIFFSAIKNHLEKSSSSIDLIAVLTEYFEGNMSQSHQVYCLNYTSAVFYLEKLKKREDFGTYLKWCEQKEQCKRLHLSELLVAPLHKLTRYPLLLKNIWKHTEPAEKVVIGSLKEKVEKSIRNLEGKVKWLDNFQKFKQLQEIIIWPSLWDQDKRFFLPEGLKNTIRDNPSENILSPTKRSLVHEGRLTLAEHMRVVDVYLFLFDDLLLITKPNRLKKKSGSSDLSLNPACPFFSMELQSLLEDSSYCTVLDQPIPLDRLTIRNIDSFHITVLGLRNAFLIQHENRYQQCIAAFLLQAQTESIKKTWMSQMETAILNYSNRLNRPQTTFSTLAAESSEI